MFAIKKLYRFVIYFLLVLLTMVLLVGVGLRLLILPNLNHYLPTLQQYVLHQSGMDFQIKTIDLEFDQLQPAIILHGVKFKAYIPQQASTTNPFQNLKDLSIERLKIRFSSWRWLFHKSWQQMVDAIMMRNASIDWQDLQGDSAIRKVKANHINLSLIPSKHKYIFTFRLPKLYLQSRLLHVVDLDLENLFSQGLWEKNSQGQLVQINQARIDDPKVKLSFHGTWHNSPKHLAGIQNVIGSIQYLDLTQLYRLLPSTLSLDSFEWLRKAFINGSLKKGHLILKGNPEEFPYGTHPEAGDFVLQASFNDLIFNYHQHNKHSLFWPKLVANHGDISFSRDNMLVRTSQAEMPVENKENVNLYDLKGQVSHLESNPIVLLDGTAQADASTWLKLAQSTPINQYLQGQLATFEAQGLWRTNLQLQIPIDDVDSTQLHGIADVTGSDFRLDKKLPWLRNLHGKISYTTEEIKANSVKANLLGSPIILNGVIGSSKEPLNIQGTLFARSLQEYFKTKGFNRIKGQAPFDLSIRFLKHNQYAVKLSSNLIGLSYHFPSGLVKTPSERQHLEIDWRPVYSGESSVLKSRMNIRLGDVATIALVHQQKQIDSLMAKRPVNRAQSSYFQQAVIALGVPSVLPTHGLKIMGQWSKRVNPLHWKKVSEEFNSGQQGNSVLPALGAIDLKVKQLNILGLLFDQVALKVSRKAGHWKISLNSAKNQLQMDYQTRLGKRDRLSVRADNLYLNINPSIVENAKNRYIRIAEIPEISAHINQLVLPHGQVIGSLSLEGGADQNQEIWTIHSLKIQQANLQAMLHGKLIQSRHSIEAYADYHIKLIHIANLFKSLGWENISIQKGQADAQGVLYWPNLEKGKLDDIQASIQVDLPYGQLDISSPSPIQWLQLLSIQSLSQIAHLPSNIKGALGGGLDFRRLSIRAQLHGHQLVLKSLHLDTSPVTVVADGQIDLQSKILALQAIAVPHIEMSGVAVLTGALINPAFGVGAFLAQLVLSQPLAHSLTQKFDISGSWEHPSIHQK